VINSRDLKELHPTVQAKAKAFIDACKAQGIDLLVTSTYRDHESQNALYAQGRTAPGKKVTNAKGGQSFHNWRVALDVVPLRNGKPVWGTTGEDGKLWQKVGEIGEASGLEWAGRWKKFPEQAHFQWTGGLTIADFQAGKRLP
jgi:peptidoglycan LD-endopeptidase CwlK